MSSAQFERAVAWLQAVRENTDHWRLRVGIRVARTERQYGAGTVERLARESGYSRRSLYEYAAVARFCVGWLGVRSAHFFDDHPVLTFSHLRLALRLDFESAIEALTEAEGAAMTVDQFAVYVARLRGRPVSPALFDQTGLGYDVIQNLIRANSDWRGRRVRITVREMNDGHE